MPQTTYEKQSTPRAYVYDGVLLMDVDSYTVVASQTNTTVSSYTPLAANVKIMGCCIVASSSTNGVTAFNVVLGTGAETGLAPADNSETAGYPATTAAAGNSVFATDQAVTLVAGVPQLFSFPVPDAIWPKGGLITSRFVTGATVAGIVKIKMMIKIFDNNPQAPSKYNRTIQYSDL